MIYFLGYSFCFNNEMRCRGILHLIKNVQMFSSASSSACRKTFPIPNSMALAISKSHFQRVWIDLKISLDETPSFTLCLFTQKYECIQFHLRRSPHIFYLWTTFMLFSSYLSAVRTKRKITLERGKILKNDAISLHKQL